MTPRSEPSLGRDLLVGAVPPAIAVASFTLWASLTGGDPSAETDWLPVAFGLFVLVSGGVAAGVRTPGGRDAFGTAFVGSLLGMPVGFLLFGLLAVVVNGFDVLHLAASLVLLVLFGGTTVLLLLPYPITAGVAGAVVARQS